MARRTRSIAAAVSLPSGWRPNMTVPSTARAAATDAALAVEGHGQRLAGVRERRDVRQERARVDVDGMSADRFDDGDAGAVERLAEVGRGADAVVQVVLLDHLRKALGDGLQVAPGEAAVGREALGQDEQVAAA